MLVLKTDHLFTIQDLRDFFEDKGVARFKVPDEIYFVDKLPYSNIGKIDKKNYLKYLIRTD